ncbi:MAG: carbohydrate porin [Pseudomonadota bacterium]
MRRKSISGIRVLLLVIGILVSSGGTLLAAGDAVSTDELRSLREKLRTLEEKTAAQEKALEEQKRAACEIVEKVDVINRRLGVRLPEEGPCWHESVTIDAALLAVGQGSSGVREAGDKTDGSLRMQFGLTSTAIKNGIIRLDFWQGEGDGLTTEIDSFTGTNDTTYTTDGQEVIYEAWYQHKFFDGKLSATVGKIDFTNYFDANGIAGCECSQFLASGFVWNPAIEWAADSLGAVIDIAPQESLYLRVGASGTNNWEDILSHPFAIAEFGISGEWPHPGNYRVYSWLNASRHDKYADLTAGATSDDTAWGAGFSFDQYVTEDIGLFARAGYQAEDYYPSDLFWSVGGHILGRGWNRPDDALGIAYGVADLSDEYKTYLGNNSITKDEKHIEVYYRFQVNEKLSVSPDFQVLFNPLGNDREDEVYLMALRGYVEF